MAALLRLVFVCLFGTTMALAAPVIRDDVAVTVTTQQVGDTVRLIATSRDGMDITLTVNLGLENMRASRPIPCTVDLSGRSPVEVVTLRADRPGVWKYHYNYNWRYGGRGSRPDPAAVYLLPYSSRETHLLAQGNFGGLSHGPGSENEYAFDFKMPVGTPVYAARDGVVCGVRADSEAGGADPKYKHCDNYVMVRHADGTYAEYVHLSPGTARVRVGERVGAGQMLALSGLTGMTTGPHLHFCVYRGIDGLKREALPIKFRLRNGTSGTLVEGRTY